MSHFNVEQQTTGDLITNYPHTPTDIAQSFADYLEAKFSAGWDYCGSVMLNQSDDEFYVFKANAQ